jgi:hypothetical protein
MSNCPYLVITIMLPKEGRKPLKNLYQTLALDFYFRIGIK